MIVETSNETWLILQLSYIIHQLIYITHLTLILSINIKLEYYTRLSGVYPDLADSSFLVNFLCKEDDISVYFIYGSSPTNLVEWIWTALGKKKKEKKLKLDESRSS